jgi:uncharacterized protein (TIGR01777 family)
MRIIITGGTGLIGTAAARELAAAGHEVVALTRDPTRAGRLPAEVRTARWDGATAAGWADLLDVPATSAILHLAGEAIAEGRWTAAKKRRIRDSRVQSGAAVLAALRQAVGRGAPPPVLLQASAVGYYGDCGDELVTEEHRPGEGFLPEVCRAWEDSTAAAEELGVRRVLLRTGIVLDREGGALPKMALPFRLLAGGPLGSGRQWVPWIHAADEVGAIRFLLEHDDARGPFNLTAPEPVRNRDLMREIGRVLGRPSLLPAPAFALRLMVGELADSLLEGQRAVPRRLQELGCAFRFSRLNEALEDLLGR